MQSGQYLRCFSYWIFDICCILKVQHSIYVAHWKLEICCTLKSLIFVANWNFNICCKLKIQYVLQIESSRCGAQWKFEMYSTLKMSPRPFPLLRINSLFHLLRIATADTACSDLSTWQKKQLSLKMSTKSLDSQKCQLNYQLSASFLSPAQCRC